MPDNVFASGKDITDINSLSITPSTVRLNVTATTVSEASISHRSPKLALSMMYGIGTDISTVIPRRSDSAVADAPIIWFITSLTALMFSSSNWKSGSMTNGFPNSWFNIS